MIFVRSFLQFVTDILVDDTDNPVTDLHFVLGQLRETQENVSGLNDSDLSAIKVLNLLLPAVNVIASKTAICSVVRQNTYAIDKQKQYSRRENIRITGLPENDDVNDFDTFKQFCGKMGIEVKKEDIVACHRVGDPGKKTPRTSIVRFVSRDFKFKILTNKKKL